MVPKGDGNWTLEDLTGGAVAVTSPVNAEHEKKESVKHGKGKKHGAQQKGEERDPLMWGFPGHMTAEEAAIYFTFKAEVDKRGGDFRKTVFCFGEEEGEVWALARWLRARKFVLEDVIKMVEEATEVRKDALARDFYPDPVKDIGCDKSLYFAQYPQLYSGVAKNGAPIFISKPGSLNVDGIQCLTSVDGIIKFHWFVQMHEFANRLREEKAKNPNFHRFEAVCILDLEGLSSSQLSRRGVNIVKEKTFIDSLCFPETMSKMFIVNAPSFFSATWRMVKGWLDARTVNKIEIFSNKAAAEARMLEFIDENQLPSDYGGKGPDTHATLAEGFCGETSRLITKVLYLRGHGSETIEVKAGELVEVMVYTRSTVGAKFTLTDADKKDHLVDGIEVKHVGSEDVANPPTHKVINDKLLAGPMHLKVKADSHAGRFSTQHFLLVFSFSQNTTGH